MPPRPSPCSKRRCPGEELSTLAIKLVCVEVLGRYELELVEGQDPSECNDTALPVPTSGLRSRLSFSRLLARERTAGASTSKCVRGVMKYYC